MTEEPEVSPHSQSESIEWEEKVRFAARLRPTTEEDAMKYADEAIEAVKQAITTAVAKAENECAELLGRMSEQCNKDIEAAVAKREKELVEEVEKEYTTHEDTKAHGRCNVQCHKITENMAKDFFLSLLKH